MICLLFVSFFICYLSSPQLWQITNNKWYYLINTTLFLRNLQPEYPGVRSLYGEHRHCVRTLLHRYTRAGLPEICPQENARATAKVNTGQNIDKGHIPRSRIVITISDLTGKRTRAAGFEGRDSADHPTATDINIIIFSFMQSNINII